MASTAPDRQEGELRRRLEEAEETIRAIREGEVDALVIRREAKDAVFALEAQDSYRGFMEAMDIGAVAADLSGQLIYANAAFAKLLGLDPRALLDRSLFEVVGPTAGGLLRQLLSQAADGRASRQIVLPGDRGQRHVEVSAAPLSFGFGQGFAVTFTDITERIEAAAAEESERIGRAIMVSSNEAVIVCDTSGIVTHANAAARAISEGRISGQSFEDAFPLGFDIKTGLMSSRDLVDVALAGSTVNGVEATSNTPGSTSTLLLSASPLRQAGQVIGGCVVTLTDITERKAAEKRQALLMGELTHRVRNTLTLVLSIANRTIASATSLHDFRDAFGRRLQALAATHNLLAEGAIDGLTLEDILAAELAPYIAVESSRLSLDGLDLVVSSQNAVALGLIFHELVTNAVKYGALSNEVGRISISASPQRDGFFELLWEESGGPTVVTPDKTGFGQTLITRGLGQSGDHATQVDFDPAGLRCRMFVPAKD